MKKPINFIITPGLFHFDLMVSIGQSNDELIEALKNKSADLTEADPVINMDSNARLLQLTNGTMILRVRNNIDSIFWLSVLQHEIFHAATFILDRAGVKFCLTSSDEVYAYLIQDLTYKIYSELKIKV